MHLTLVDLENVPVLRHNYGRHRMFIIMLAHPEGHPL